LNSSPSFNSKNLGKLASSASSAFLCSIFSWRSRWCWCLTSLVHCWSSSELESKSEGLSSFSESPCKKLTAGYKHVPPVMINIQVLKRVIFLIFSLHHFYWPTTGCLPHPLSWVDWPPFQQHAYMI
jgi:hypothetical protein